MPDDVAERFLQDAQQGRRALLVEDTFGVIDLQVAGDAVAPLELPDLPFDGGVQSDIEHRRAQVID